MRLIHKIKRTLTGSTVPDDFEVKDLSEEKLEAIAEQKASAELKSDPDFEIPDIDLEQPDDLALN